MRFEYRNIVKLPTPKAWSDQLSRLLPGSTICRKDAMPDQGFESLCSPLADTKVLKLAGKDRFYVRGIVGKDAELSKLLEIEGVAVSFKSSSAEGKICRVSQGLKRVAEHVVAQDGFLFQRLRFLAAMASGKGSLL